MNSIIILQNGMRLRLQFPQRTPTQADCVHQTLRPCRAETRWYGELIKMMFPLQGAFRFNSLFAVFAVAHPILRNGTSYAHKHNFSEAFTFAYGFFHISMALH